MDNKLKLKLQRCYYKIKSKCYNPKDAKYYIYGARGISMCQEWRDNINNFYDWAINNGVEIDLTIDRIDVNGNYEPSNCRWVNNYVQQNNKRTNIILTHNNITMTLKQWCDYYKLYYPSVKNRYNFCKKHNIEINERIFDYLMKPSFYYKGTEFVDLILGINRNKIPDKYKNIKVSKNMEYYYNHREQILKNARIRYKNKPKGE